MLEKHSLNPFKSTSLHHLPITRYSIETVNISYYCSENITNIIQKLNRKITNKSYTSTKPTYNCRVKHECPFNGNCLQSNIIYQATIKTADNEEKIYIRVTEGPGKQRNYSQKNTLYI